MYFIIIINLEYLTNLIIFYAVSWEQIFIILKRICKISESKIQNVLNIYKKIFSKIFQIYPSN